MTPDEKTAYERFRDGYQLSWRQYLDPIAARARTNPTPSGLPDPDPARRSRVWAHATTLDGRGTTVMLEAGEGYTFTAESAVRAVEAVLAAPGPGAHSPGAFLGADFALNIPGTRRIDVSTPVVG